MVEGRLCLDKTKPLTAHASPREIVKSELVQVSLFFFFLENALFSCMQQQETHVPRAEQNSTFAQTIQLGSGIVSDNLKDL